MRKIIVYSTKGKSGSFDSNAKTWGEIQSNVKGIVGDLDNLIATENVNKTNLGHQDSILPEGDFKIFLRPSKTKSGATNFSSMSFKELRVFIAEKGQPCKDYLNAEAKNLDKSYLVSNFVFLKSKLDQKINALIGIEKNMRNEMTIEQIELAISSIEQIAEHIILEEKK